MSNKREFSGSFDETNLDVKKPKRTIQDFFVPSIASKQVPVSEAVAGNSTDVGEVVSVPSASAESSSSPQLPEFHLFIDNVRNLSDSGIPLDDFGYAVKIVSEGVYTLSDSDIHHFSKSDGSHITRKSFLCRTTLRMARFDHDPSTAAIWNSFRGWLLADYSSLKEHGVPCVFCSKRLMREAVGLARVSAWDAWC